MQLLFISLRDLYHAWNNLFFSFQPTLTICVFRIFAGLLLVIESIQWMIWYRQLLSVNGYFSYEAYRTKVQRSRFSLFSYLPIKNSTVVLVILLQFFTALFLMLGIWPQLAALGCFITTVSIHHRNPYVIDSGDSVRRFFCLFLVFAPSGSQLSLSDPLHLIHPEARGWPWSLFLIQFFIANIYLKNILFKLSGPSWRTGTATEMLFQARAWVRFVLPRPFRKKWFFRTSTYGTLLIELCLFSLIWINEFRPAVISFGILFHLALWLVLRIGFFQLTMICGFLCFITSDEYMNFFRWIGLV